MSAASVAARGRKAAESLMLDTGKALRPTGGYTVVGGIEVPATSALFGSTVSPVPCKIKPPSVTVTESEVGDRTAVTVPAELHIAADPTHPEYAEMKPGDLWEMVTINPLSLSRVGRQYEITSEVDGSLVTACRYKVERVVS